MSAGEAPNNILRSPHIPPDSAVNSKHIGGTSTKVDTFYRGSVPDAPQNCLIAFVFRFGMHLAYMFRFGILGSFNDFARGYHGGIQSYDGENNHCIFR